MISHTVTGLIHTSVADLDSTIRCSIINKRPISLDTLRDALNAQQALFANRAQ